MDLVTRGEELHHAVAHLDDLGEADVVEAAGGSGNVCERHQPAKVR